MNQVDEMIELLGWCRELSPEEFQAARRFVSGLLDKKLRPKRPIDVSDAWTDEDVAEFGKHLADGLEDETPSEGPAFNPARQLTLGAP